MRTEYSIKNTVTAIFSNIITLIFAFVSQTVFIKILGAEYLGLNGLYANISTMLNIFDLGIGSAIVYNLYKPIAENNIEKINSLMQFYKKTYNVIAILVLIFGLLVLPFLNTIVGNITIDVNIHFAYVLYILSSVMSYLMIYKQNIIIATQRNYIINIIHMIYLMFLNLSQIAILIITKNFYLYLGIRIIWQIIENIVITYVSNKLFKDIYSKNVKKLDKEIEKDIFCKVKALIFHRIGMVFVIGTDNIIISHFLGVVAVGLYSNYCIIVNAIKTIFTQVLSSITASVGNLLVSETTEKAFITFKKIRFFNFWIACFTSICLIVMIQPFITFWIGKEYLLGFNVVFLIVFNYFQKIMRNAYTIFKDSAGIWIEDKYVPIIEALLNIVFSIVFLKMFGLAGVFMGTIVSGLVLWCYSYPKFVYKKLFNGKYFNYAKETFGYVVLFLIIELFTYGISTYFVFDNIILKLFVNMIIALFIPNLIMCLLFRKTDNFNYFKDLIIKILCKIKNKVKA